jgi:hypothetical protein
LFLRRSQALLGPPSRSAIAGDTFTAADISCGYVVGLSRFLGCEERLEATLRDYVRRLLAAASLWARDERRAPLD